MPLKPARRSATRHSLDGRTDRGVPQRAGQGLCPGRPVLPSRRAVVVGQHHGCGLAGLPLPRLGVRRGRPLCTRTPVPEGFRVRSYPCIEQEHYVWVWMREGPPTVAAPAAIPGAGEHAWRQGTVEVACSADLMLDNILDSSHIPFV